MTEFGVWTASTLVNGLYVIVQTTAPLYMYAGYNIRHRRLVKLSPSEATAKEESQSTD